MSVIFILQVLGIARDTDQITSACDSVDFDRLTDINLNSTMIKGVLCGQDLDDYIPAEYSNVNSILPTWLGAIWAQQALFVMYDHQEELCDMFNVSRASFVNMDGLRVRAGLCTFTKDPEKSSLNVK